MGSKFTVKTPDHPKAQPHPDGDGPSYELTFPTEYGDQVTIRMGVATLEWLREQLRSAIVEVIGLDASNTSKPLPN